jgi:hypothetical protein
MRARTVGIVAALVGGVGWMAKIVIMAFQGGPDPDSIPEAIAFFTGLVGVVVAAGAAGAHLARRASTLRRGAAAVAAIVVVAAAVAAGEWALNALPGDGWLQDEAMFGITGLVAVLVALLALGRRGEDGAAARHPS